MATITATSPGTIWVSTTGGTTGSSWQAWNQHWYQVGATAAAGTTWTQWNTSYENLNLTVNYGAPEPETGEQRAERERAAELARERSREVSERLARERAVVRGRADELLVALLSAEQEQTWREHNWFTVRGSRSGRAYRIRRGYAGNVDLLDEAGLAEVTYCAHPPDVPPEDADIAQMLALVTDEDAFLAVANATPRRRLRAVPPAAGQPAQQVQAAA